MGGGVARARAHDHLPRDGSRLEAGRRVRHVAHHGVLAVLGWTHDAGHHLARVDSDVDRALDAGVPRRLDLGDHFQRAPHCPLGIVLMRGRRTEHGHDAVTEHVHDRPAVPDHVLAHLTRHVGADGLHLFGVPVLGQAGEPGEVGEEDRGDPPLLAQRRPGTTPDVQLGAARSAVGGGELVDRVASRAHDRKSRPARAAEALSLGVLRSARRATRNLPHPITLRFPPIRCEVASGDVQSIPSTTTAGERRSVPTPYP